jgi:Flp pilus assembly protein TadD
VETGTAFSLTGKDKPNGNPGATGLKAASRDTSDRGARRHLAGDVGGAKTDYEAALALDPNNATAHNNLGFLLAQQGLFDAAVGHYEKALELDPRKSMAMANMGITRVSQGQDEEGLAWLRRAVETDQRNILAWDNLCRLLLKMRRLTEAEAASRAGIESANNDARLYLTLGLAVAGQQRLAEAADLLKRAVELDPESGERMGATRRGALAEAGSGLRRGRPAPRRGNVT